MAAGPSRSSRTTISRRPASISMAFLKILLFVEAEFGFWMPDEDLVKRTSHPPVPWRITSVDTGGRPSRQLRRRQQPMASRLARKSVSVRTRRLPLRGADLVLLAMQCLWTGAKVSHNTILVRRVRRALAPARVRRALDRFLECCPWPASRLRRRSLGQASRAAGAPCRARRLRLVRHRRVGSREEAPESWRPS